MHKIKVNSTKIISITIKNIKKKISLKKQDFINKIKILEYNQFYQINNNKKN